MNQEMLTTADVAVTAVLPGAYEDLSQAVGQIARQEVVTGQQITSAVTGASSGGSTTQIDTPAGLRAMSVMVDQISGVGTLIKPGDWVDMVIRMDVKPVVVSEDGTSATAVDAVDGDTSKLLLQGMQVLGTLLPPPPATTEGATPAPGAALQERQELVILGLTAEQTEVVKWAQNDAQVSMSLVLRSADDFVDANGNRIQPESPCLTERPLRDACASHIARAGSQPRTSHSVPVRDHAWHRARLAHRALRCPDRRYLGQRHRRTRADAGA